MRLLSLNVELSLPDRFMSLSFTWTASSEVRSKSAEFGPLEHRGESARTPVVRAAPWRREDAGHWFFQTYCGDVRARMWKKNVASGVLGLASQITTLKNVIV